MGIDTSSPEFAPFQMDGTTLVGVLDPKVKEVVIPHGVRKIGDEAFFQCRKLTAVHLPDSLQEIGMQAFGECFSLHEMDVPNSVKQIRMGAFIRCTRLKTIHLPERLEKIAMETFCNTGLITMDIPNTVREIGTLAFGGCGALEEIHLPQALTHLGMEAFRDCTGLKTIRLPKQLQRIGAKTFYDCGLEEIDLPPSLRKIGDSGFYGCSSLVRVGFSEALTEIGAHAFEGCTSLTALHLPENLNKIGDFAFFQVPYGNIRGGNPEMTLGRDLFFKEQQKQTLSQILEFMEPHFLHIFPVDVQVSYCNQFFNTLTTSEQEALCQYLDQETEARDIVLKSDHIPLIRGILQTKERISLLFLEEYLSHSIQEGRTEITAMLLIYKNEHYSHEERDTFEERQFLLELCEEIPTFDEFSKKWDCSLEQGEVTIYGYIGSGFVEVIPKVLADGAVVRYFKWGQTCSFKEGVLEELVVEADLLGWNPTCLPQSLKILRFTGTLHDITIPFPLEDLEHLTLPQNLSRLRRGILSQIKGLKTLTVPFSVKKIEAGALPAYGGCMMYGEAHSFVERYCLRYGFSFSLLEE